MDLTTVGAELFFPEETSDASTPAEGTATSEIEGTAASEIEGTTAAEIEGTAVTEIAAEASEGTADIAGDIVFKDPEVGCTLPFAG